MTRILWIVAGFAVALWSLIAWGAYGLVDVFGGLAARNADVVTGQPEIVEWLGWLMSLLRGLGLTAVVIVWALVSAAILAVPALASLISGGSRRHYEADRLPPHQQPFPPAPRPDNARRARDLVDRFRQPPR